MNKIFYLFYLLHRQNFQMKSAGPYANIIVKVGIQVVFNVILVFQIKGMFYL